MGDNFEVHQQPLTSSHSSAQAAITDSTLPHLPSPPFIKAPGIANLRDAGGYPIQGQPGKMVKRGVLFRSADPTKATDEGLAVFKGLGITHVYDFRSAQELKTTPPRDFEGTKRVFVPVFLNTDYSPEALALRFGDYASGPEGFVRAYQTLMAGAADPQNEYAPYRTVLEHLASSSAPPSPLLVHCTAGKDRTGVLCALVLALCGVDDETIADEYSLTELGLAERREEIIAHILPRLGGDRNKAEIMCGARKENMIGTLAMIRKVYGSVESYVVDHLKISPESVAQIRRNLIVDVPREGSPLKL